MVRNSNAPAAAASRSWDTKKVVRTSLGTLLALNLVALALVLFPIGGSAEDLERQRAELSSQMRGRQKQLEQVRLVASKVEKGREEAEKFLNEYFLARRTAYQTILGDLGAAAKDSKITVREHSYKIDPIEGSDTLSMMTISANYEGSYADLMQFVNLIDRSERLLIMESLNAAPQQGQNRLSVAFKLDTFVREEPGATLP